MTTPIATVPPPERTVPRPKSPRLKVEVTRDIIDRAQQRDSGHCMIAEAVKAAFPHLTGVSVDLQTVRASDPSLRLRYIYLTPWSVQLALIGFDQGIPVDPFVFVLGRATVLRMGPAGAHGRGRDGRSDRKRGAKMPEGNKAELIIRDGRVNGKTTPEKVGGVAPPIGPLSNTTYKGKRRAFGLRLLKA